MIRIANLPAFFVGDIKLAVDWKTKSGGLPIYGQEMIVASTNHVWNAEIEIILVDQQIKIWEAFVDTIRGRSGAIRIAIPVHWCDDLYSRLAFSVGGPSIPYSDGTRHSDGTGFAREMPFFKLEQAADFWAQDVLIDMTGYALGLQMGDCLGIDGNLYRVASAVPESLGMRVGINPPLRRPLPAGTAVSTDPRPVFRLETDLTGTINKTPEPIARAMLKLTELPDLK